MLVDREPNAVEQGLGQGHLRGPHRKRHANAEGILGLRLFLKATPGPLQEPLRLVPVCRLRILVEEGLEPADRVPVAPQLHEGLPIHEQGGRGLAVERVLAHQPEALVRRRVLAPLERCDPFLEQQLRIFDFGDGLRLLGVRRCPRHADA